MRDSRLRLAAALALCLSGFSVPALAQSVLGADAPRLSYKFSIDYFFQTSTRQNYAFNDERFADSETFFWERLRPKLTLSNQRVNIVLEAQDTHSRGSEFTVRTAWFDVLNAYVDVKQRHGFSFKFGRRQGDFDTISRLIRTPDFAAVVRSFDVAEVAWQKRRTDVRAFAVHTVDNLPNRFNTWKRGERMWTLYGRQGIGKQAVQTYLTTRQNTGVISESGVSGSGTLYAWETLATGPLPVPRLGYTIEHVLQRGNASTDKIRASALFGSLTASIREGHDLEMRYIRSSGDEGRGDGIRGAYDIFYMAVAAASPLGLMRVSNLHAISIGGSSQLVPKGLLQWRIHDSHVTTLQDGWYSTRLIRRPGATSTRIGNEINAQFTYTFSPKLNARLGYYRFFSGGYLKETGTSGAPYEVRVQIFGTL